MKVSKAAKTWIDYHRTHSKKTTVRAMNRSYQNSVKNWAIMVFAGTGFK
jgi:hypothetical protein